MAQKNKLLRKNGTKNKLLRTEMAQDNKLLRTEMARKNKLLRKKGTKQ